MDTPTEGTRPVPGPSHGVPSQGVSSQGEPSQGEIDAPELFGQYLLYESLGSGAMASVRRGVLCGTAGFRRAVALKQLHPHLAKIPEVVELFAREARLGSYLRHANLAQTFDFGSVDGAYFLAMELVRGPTLAQLARQCASAAGPVPLGIVVGILIQLCDAFDYIRTARDPLGQPLDLAHCDVSPTNVILSSTGFVKLIDFGISRAASSQLLVETGMLRRRLAYVAPEYAHGKLDARSDLFSLGVIGHELIANQPLFAGSGDELGRVRDMPIPPLTRDGPVPHALQDIIMTALQRDPDRRWQTAAEMRSALSEIARGMAVHIGPPQIAGWIRWAFSQRVRPHATTPLAVIPPAGSGCGNAFQDAPTKLRPPGPRSAAPAPARRARWARLPSVHHLPLATPFTRELTRRFQRSGALRRRPAAGTAIEKEPLRRKLAHTVPRGLRKAERLRGTLAVGAERDVPPNRSTNGSAARAAAAARTSEAIRAAHPAAVRTPEPPQATARPTAGRASTPASTIAGTATARTPGAPRASVGLPAASPSTPAIQVAGTARNTPPTTGVVVVPASLRSGGAASRRARARNTQVVRLGRRSLRSALPVVFAILAALVAFALAYRWLRT
ncbi:MAG TPA: protein kinase [Kofleriaceae bacterium]|nr:protein kinase [Kofleriaceae bacterium]